VVEKDGQQSLMPKADATAGETGSRAVALLYLGPATGVVLITLLAPLCLLARYSVNRYDPMELMIAAVTPANYVRFFTDSYYLDVMSTTLFIAVVSTALCLALGLPIAWRLARMESRWKSLAVLLVVLPLFVGSTVRTVGWLILFSKRGLLDQGAAWLVPGGHIDMMYTRNAVLIGIVSFNLPYMVLTLQSVLEGIDIRLVEAARGLGADPMRSFWRIVWPLALPGVATASILVFILSMNSYATPVLLGGPRFHMMAPELYAAFATDNNWPFASAMAFILMAVTLLLTGAANALIPRRFRVA
jgi:putative spermidine/putrescine transport system permease protein